MNHPLAELIQKKKSLVIDGAMSTALEALGCDLNDPLWSAKVLFEAPEKIRTVHENYFKAGADVAITASYQASEKGFAKKGISAEESYRLIKLSVELAKEARSAVDKDLNDLLVAGSVGPYGAYLADGSEYRGDYSLTVDEYKAFHRLRIEALKEGGADLIAVETMPRLDEVEAILSLLEETDQSCWVTFTLKDESHISCGTLLSEAAEVCAKYDCVDAIGINCVKQEYVAGALDTMKDCGKPLIVYPNSGEIYDPKTKTWHHGADSEGWSSYIGRWQVLGASCFGGCCRTLPKDILEIASLVRTNNR